MLEIYTDGACRGNPGPASISYLFIQDNEIIKKHGEYLGNSTNNRAEYKAIILALDEAKCYTRNTVKVHSDSELAIRQITKLWKINNPNLSELCNKVYQCAQLFKIVEFFHVCRENQYIKICDKICNDKLNTKCPKKK